MIIDEKNIIVTNFIVDETHSKFTDDSVLKENVIAKTKAMQKFMTIVNNKKMNIQVDDKFKQKYTLTCIVE